MTPQQRIDALMVVLEKELHRAGVEDPEIAPDIQREIEAVALLRDIAEAAGEYFGTLINSDMSNFEADDRLRALLTRYNGEASND